MNPALRRLVVHQERLIETWKVCDTSGSVWPAGSTQQQGMAPSYSVMPDGCVQTGVQRDVEPH
jgi:hypothetical protein